MPPRLFRFLPKPAATFLEAKKIWFSNILDFNDPFDATPSFTEITDQSYQSLGRKTFGRQSIAGELQQRIEQDKAEAVPILTRFFQERFSECFGVVCFTARNDWVPMWARYASNHEGFAVEFNPEHPLFSNENFGVVHYGPKRPQLALATSGLEQELRKLAFTKSDQWIDEAEWRLVKGWRDLKEAVKPWDKKGGRYVDLPPEIVRAIYFGCRVTRQVTDEIEACCKRPEYRDVKLFQMRPDPADYKLIEAPWTGHKTEIPDGERSILQALWRQSSAGYDVP